MLDREFQLKVSKTFLIIILFLGMASLVPLFLLKNLMLTFWLGIIGAFYLTFIIRQCVLLRGKNTIVRLISLGKRHFELHTTHHLYQADLTQDSLVTTAFCILRFKKRGKRSYGSCIIFKDALTERQYRHLLILLKNV